MLSPAPYNGDRWPIRAFLSHGVVTAATISWFKGTKVTGSTGSKSYDRSCPVHMSRALAGRPDAEFSNSLKYRARGGRMNPMTPAELHKLLTEAVIAAHQELANVSEHADPSVRRAFEVLTAAIDRIIHAANEAYPDRADVATVIADIHGQRRLEGCPCPCHSDGHGQREWPLLTDSVARVTACSQCRADHDRMAPRRDSAA